MVTRATAGWVALLRGVNVGGVTVLSADLRACLAGAGLTGVRTVLASGNAVFDVPADDAAGAPADAAALRQRVGAALAQRYGREVPVLVLATERLATACAAYPFARTDDTHHPYLVLAADDAVLPGVLQQVAAAGGARATAGGAGAVGPAGERWELAGDVLHWSCPRGSSTDTPLAKALAASRWRTRVTTRTLRTLEKVLAAAGWVAPPAL